MKMPQLIFATNNPNKLAEVRGQLKGSFEILSLQDIGCNEELPETTGTIEGNAVQKAEFVQRRYNVSCFADDTGLEIDSLNGEPGVDSAFYAGTQRSADDNMGLVLNNLKGKEDRRAQFKTVVALASKNGTEQFEGIVRGTITTEKSGSSGFGYDPIFKPNGYDQTFSEMTQKEKSIISHRGIAVRALIHYLIDS